MRLVQTGNVGVAEYLDKPNNKKWISEDTFDRLHCEEVLPGDILISRLPEPAGRACIVPLLGTKMITAVDCTIVRTAPDMSNKFLVQYLSSQAYFDDVNTCLAGGTRQRISRGNLANFNVPIPVKKSEQDAIGMFFGYLDNLITLHQRQPFLHSPPDISLIVQLAPPFYTFSWEQRKLGDVVQITMGQSPDGSTYSDEPSDYILVQGNADLQNGWVCPRIWTTQITKKADAGDLIMSVRAPAGAMGKTAYNAVIGRGVAAIKGNEFIYQLLVKMDADGFWKTLSCGSTLESLNSDNIKNAEVKIPTTAEQIKIGGYFQQLDNLITLHQRQTIVYAVIRSIRKVILAERQYFAPPMVRKSP